MHDLFPALVEILILFGVSLVVVIFFSLLRQPAIAGFLISGAIIGPYGLGWIDDLDRIHFFSEVGIILLLFSLGVEFSIQKMMRLKQAFFGVGLLQCILTSLLAMLIFWAIGFSLMNSLVFGLLISISSTAIVLKILQQRRELVTPHGQVSVAVLLFQDLWVVPIMLLIPVLASSETFEFNAFIKSGGIGLAKAALILLFVWLGAKFLAPRFLKLVAKTQMRELFLVAVFLLCLGTAAGTAVLGLSLALGAFLAGLMISESDYGHQAVADVIPMRDLFVAIFFISVGMLMNVGFLFQHWPIVLLLAAGVLILKFGITASISSFLGFESRVAALVGIYIAQVGEFSFVLAEQARRIELITETHYQFFLSTTLILMLITPSLIQLSPRLAPKLGTLDLIPKRTRRGIQKKLAATDQLESHVLIIGFGLNGKDLAEVLHKVHVPFIAIDINQSTVEEYRKKGVSIIYGDASRPEVLEAASLRTARMVVIAISDPAWVHPVIQSIRRVRPDIHILVRAHYDQEVPRLEASGASDIVVGELETGIEIFARVLQQYHIDNDLITQCVDKMQKGRYQQFRQIVQSSKLDSLKGWTSGFEMTPLKLSADSPWIGKSIAEIQLRERLGLIIAGIHRDDLGYRMPDANFQFEEGDEVFIVGETGSAEKLHEILDESENRLSTEV